jgi:FMN phosphatase YigB (HAD superfamily)
VALGSTPRFIVTNCSQKLGERAAKQAGEFSFVMTAEQAGAYKPDPRPYRAALAAIGMEAKRVLFVAGSAHDIGGARHVGMDVYWANRHLVPPPEGPAPLVHASDLGKLAALLNG